MGKMNRLYYFWNNWECHSKNFRGSWCWLCLPVTGKSLSGLSWLWHTCNQCSPFAVLVVAYVHLSIFYWVHKVVVVNMFLPGGARGGLRTLSKKRYRFGHSTALFFTATSDWLALQNHILKWPNPEKQYLTFYGSHPIWCCWDKTFSRNTFCKISSALNRSSHNVDY